LPPIRRTTILAALLFEILLGPAAAAWTTQEFRRSETERGVGLVQPAAGDVGLALAIGCEEQWRQIGLFPRGPAPMILAGGGEVTLGFQPAWLTTAGGWKVQRLAEGRRSYLAPSSDLLLGRLYAAESADPNATLYLRLRPRGEKPVVIEFPLRGLSAAVREHLWERCDLERYYGHLR